jgi:DNA-binding GntR family transcriptional regulator
VSNAAVKKNGKTRRALATWRQTRTAPVPPAHGATVAFIAERLREEILAGRLEPGSRLIESQLTVRFAVSRGPVREALRRLNADGLIEHRPHRGAVVRRLTEREIRELFLIRIEMEALAARLAATADAPERRARFVASVEPIHSDAPRNPCDYLKENAAFHDAVMALADNIELRNLAIRLQLPLIMAQVGDVLTPPVLEASVREHRLIAKAILERDQVAASARMREHLERAAAVALAARAAGAMEQSRNDTPPLAPRARRSPSGPDVSRKARAPNSAVGRPTLLDK